MLYDKVQHYKESGLMLKNTPAQYKKEHEFLKEADLLALAIAQLNLKKAYKNFCREQEKGNSNQGFPKYKISGSKLNEYQKTSASFIPQGQRLQ